MSTWRISGSSYDIYFAREVPRIPANSTLENTPSATWIDLIEQRAVGATSEERASNFAAPAKRHVPGLRYIDDSPTVMERYYRVLGVVSWCESVPPAERRQSAPVNPHIVWQSTPISRKRSNDAAAPRAAKRRPAHKECDGAALPKYVPSNLRKLLRKECANRRGYCEWSDVARMCADEALFQEVASSEWNARAHNACSCAINAYRDKVLHLTRLKTRNPRKRDRVKARPALPLYSVAHTKRALPALPAARAPPGVAYHTQDAW